MRTLLTQTVSYARSVVLIVRQLYSRDTRRQFCPPHHWINDKIVLPQDRYQDISFRRSRIRGEQGEATTLTCLKNRDSNEGYPKVRNHGEGPY